MKDLIEECGIERFLEDIIIDSINYTFTYHNNKNDDKKIDYEFSIVNQVPRDFTKEDIQRFFMGFEPNWGLVFKRIPVDRYAYVLKKDEILSRAEKMKNKSGILIYTITGPRGIGKTTLGKQMAVDLVEKGYSVIWADISGNLSESFIAGLNKFLRNQDKNRTHIFLKVDMCLIDRHYGNTALKNVRKIINALGQVTYVSLYLIIDAIHTANAKLYIDDEMPYGLTTDQIELKINMEPRELKQLIRTLKHYNCLGRLTERSEDDILELFLEHSGKQLLASLLETLYKTSDRDNFQQIIRREYDSLDPSISISYPLVALCDSSGIRVPSTLLYRVLKQHNPDYWIPIPELINKYLYGVLNEKYRTVGTRHKLIARTLCNAIFDQETIDSLGFELVHSIFSAIDENQEEHREFLFEFSLEKVFDFENANEEYFDHLIDYIKKGRYKNLGNYSLSIILNTIARIYQGRNELKKAIQVANTSYDLYPNINNNAKVIMGYCYNSISKSKNTAQKIAQEILDSENARPLNLFLALRLLNMAGMPDKAKYYIDAYRDKLCDLSGFNSLNKRIGIAIIKSEDSTLNSGPYNKHREIRLDIDKGLIQISDAKVAFSEILTDYPLTRDVLLDYCHYCFRLNDFKSILDVCDVTETAISEHKRDGGNIPEEEIKIIESIVPSTKAWAIYKMYGQSNAETVDKLFKKSLIKNDNHPWGHYWYGIFLYQEYNEYSESIKEIRKAISLIERPPFFYGLARILYETNKMKFDQKTNNEIIQLCKSGLKESMLGDYWGDGLNQNLEILKSIAEVTKTRSDEFYGLYGLTQTINNEMAGYF